MSYLRLAFRLFFFVLGILLYFISSFVIFIIFGFSLDRARPNLTKLISYTSKMGLKIFGVKIQKKFESIDRNDNYLIISNHLSYLDILTISSILPSCFVTSQEMKETPVLGQLCTLGGCLFVERRNRRKLSGEIGELTSTLGNGLSVTVFPEAKSTNGEEVLRFRKPLFQAALNSKSKVLPICLNYSHLDGAPVTLENRDILFWYGDKSFFNHAVNLLKHREVIIEVSIMQSIAPDDRSDKHVLAEKCHEIISQTYKKII